MVGFGGSCGAGTGALAAAHPVVGVRLGEAVAPERTVLTLETPEPGMPMVRVTRPDECAVTRAPLTPSDVETPCGVTVIRTPGMTLNDLRTRKPIGVPFDSGVVHATAGVAFAGWAWSRMPA